MSGPQAHYPGRVPINAYGDGGFRFADMSHIGSLLLLPSGVFGWPVTQFGDLTPRSFAPVFDEADDISFLLLGCGETIARPSETVESAFRDHGVGLEFMDTGAAARTYNVLLGEGRDVAAALIAVENPV